MTRRMFPAGRASALLPVLAAVAAVALTACATSNAKPNSVAASGSPSASESAAAGALEGAGPANRVDQVSRPPSSAPAGRQPTIRASSPPAQTAVLPARGTKATTPARSHPGTAGCPQPGQRVKTATSVKVYLVDPGSYLNWIPSEALYERLFETWSGITVVTDRLLVDCFAFYFTMDDVHLAKKSGDAAVYIYDANGGGYRWITTMSALNRYGFSTAKIETQTSISPVSSLRWE